MTNACADLRPSRLPQRLAAAWPLMTPEEQAEVDRLLAGSPSTSLTRYQTDPVGYATEYLKVELTPEQEEMLRAIRDNRRVAIKASHAIGKTFTAAVAACWWYDCWPKHIVYVTAPTWPQA